MTRASLVFLMALAGGASQARSDSYVHVHLDEAAKVLVDCEAGSHRGAECGNADGGIAQAQIAARLSLYGRSFR